MELNLFDKHGRFVMPDQSALDALDPADRERFAPVVAAAAKLDAAERDLKTATDTIAADVLAVEAADATLRKFPAPTFHDVWRQSTGGVTRRIGT